MNNLFLESWRLRVPPRDFSTKINRLHGISYYQHHERKQANKGEVDRGRGAPTQWSNWVVIIFIKRSWLEYQMEWGLIHAIYK